MIDTPLGSDKPRMRMDDFRRSTFFGAIDRNLILSGAATVFGLGFIFALLMAPLFARIEAQREQQLSATELGLIAATVETRIEAMLRETEWMRRADQPRPSDSAARMIAAQAAKAGKPLLRIDVSEGRHWALVAVQGFATRFDLGLLAGDLAPLAAGARPLLYAPGVGWIVGPPPEWHMTAPDVPNGTTVALGGVRYRFRSQALAVPAAAASWIAVLAVPTAGLDHDVASLVERVMLVGFGFSLLSTLLFMVIGRSVGRPIASFTMVARRLAAEDTAVDIPQTDRDDELGDLARALLVLRVHGVERQRLYAEQGHRLAIIEDKVAERTAELRAAIDDLNLARDELVRSEKLAALGGMVAAIAHEINTPLGNALIVASTLQERLREFGVELQDGKLRKSDIALRFDSLESGTQMLMTSLTRAAQLVRSFKQVAVDRTSDRRRPFQLAEMVAELADTLRPKYRTRPVTLVVDIPPTIIIDSYPGPLGQVLSNLIENAYTHAFADDRSGHIAISAVDAGEWLRLVVADDGCGIPAEAQPRIFDPFFTTKLGQGGSGLGLHIAYNLVRNILGGRIEVDSKPDAGCRFILTLPRVAPASAALETDSL